MICEYRESTIIDGVNTGDGDGIGDTPYKIPGGINKDKFPLMDPYPNSKSRNKHSVNLSFLQFFLERLFKNSLIVKIILSTRLTLD